MSKDKSNTDHYVLNCVPSSNTDKDWTLDDAADGGFFDIFQPPSDTVDLREDWWKIDDQGRTGACTGYAAAYGVLRWHYYKKGMISKNQKPSARFIWMANKETDTLTSYPTTFLEKVGTETKLALKVAQKYGCVLDEDLPMNGQLSSLKTVQFYTKAASMRISSYTNLGTNLDDWRKWLSTNGPILTRLNVDETWRNASNTRGNLKKYKKNTVKGGHAVCIVGYSDDYFIVRNSWGTDWGHKGFAYAYNKYAKKAFTEAYGAVI